MFWDKLVDLYWDCRDNRNEQFMEFRIPNWEFTSLPKDTFIEWARNDYVNVRPSARASE